MLCTTGDGTTSEGEFWEALSTATNLKLPVVFLVEDNGYAISVPVEVNTPGGSISKLLTGFPGLFIQEVDGCDALASFDVLTKAAEYARARKGPRWCTPRSSGPTATPSRTTRCTTGRRPSASSTPSAIRWSASPSISWSRASPPSPSSIRSRSRWRKRCRSRPRWLWRLPSRRTDTVYNYVYSPDVDPTSEQFDTEDDPRFTGDPTTMVDLLNICLRDEMTRDPRIVLFGEDVADCSREKNLGDVKGKGGVFKVTWGLQRAFGSDRVYNSPLAEANIIGRAIGLATRGLKPVVEIQFFDYIWPAYMQLRNELALMRWRSNNAFAVAGGGAGHLRRATSRAARSITHRPAPPCSPAFPGSGWCVPRPRSMPTGSCARPFAARTRCSFSSTSTSTARPTTRRRTPGPTS